MSSSTSSVSPQVGFPVSSVKGLQRSSTSNGLAALLALVRARTKAEMKEAVQRLQEAVHSTLLSGQPYASSDLTGGVGCNTGLGDATMGGSLGVHAAGSYGMVADLQYDYTMGTTPEADMPPPPPVVAMPIAASVLDEAVAVQLADQLDLPAMPPPRSAAAATITTTTATRL